MCDKQRNATLVITSPSRNAKKKKERKCDARKNLPCNTPRELIRPCNLRFYVSASLDQLRLIRNKMFVHIERVKNFSNEKLEVHFQGTGF